MWCRPHRLRAALTLNSSWHVTGSEIENGCSQKLLRCMCLADICALHAACRSLQSLMLTRLPMGTFSQKCCHGWTLEMMLQLCSLPRCVLAQMPMPADAWQPRQLGLIYQQSPQLRSLPLSGGASHHGALFSSAGLPSLQHWVLQPLKALKCRHSFPSLHHSPELS